MRYREGPTTQVSIEVPAAPDAVWPWVTDLGVHVEASDELQDAEWLDAGPVAVGSRFQGRNHREGRDWETTSTVVEADAPWRFAWAVGDVDGPAALWRFDLVAVDGGTALTQHVRLGPGKSGLTPMIEAEPEREHEIVAWRLEVLRVGMRATVELIAARAGG